MSLKLSGRASLFSGFGMEMIDLSCEQIGKSWVGVDEETNGFEHLRVIWTSI